MAMVSPRPSPDRIGLPRSSVTDSSPSKFSPSEAAPGPAPSSPNTAETPDQNDVSDSSPNPSVEVDGQSVEALRSEEYRQLFRLPHEEVLVQDFNCALQESILIQGHMYLFAHHICFYANIFGFETKRIIAFDEVTSVKRAKTAGIFPNAIEIFAGGRKYFFASFLSRDEAFKLIHDGWSEHSKGVKATMERQDSTSEASNKECELMIDRVSSSRNISVEAESTIRDKDPSFVNDTVLTEIGPKNGSPSFDAAMRSAEPVVDIEQISSAKAWTWKPEGYDAPKMAEDYTQVAEAKFPIKVGEFFNLFFSDDAVSFLESFHRRCGDKEFKCTTWQPHDKFGHTRDISFQHPIKIYFGAKFGSCQELQKFQVYRNSHLIIETSQVINDVPYGDYFSVEGLWDVKRDCSQSKEGCVLQVYINVAFSKRTVWKGKIVQSTLEECRDVYATWIEMAHELLKHENLEKPEVNVTKDPRISSEGQGRTTGCSESLQNSVERVGPLRMSDNVDHNQRVADLIQGRLTNGASIASFLRDTSLKLFAFLKSQSRISQVLVVAFAVILLMQVTILVLLNRPQQIHMTSAADISTSWPGGFSDRSAESMAWMEKRIHYLKDEMLMVEARLERMWHEHAVLKAQLKDLEQLRKQS